MLSLRLAIQSQLFHFRFLFFVSPLDFHLHSALLQPIPFRRVARLHTLGLLLVLLSACVCVWLGIVKGKQLSPIRVENLCGRGCCYLAFPLPIPQRLFLMKEKLFFHARFWVGLLVYWMPR